MTAIQAQRRKVKAEDVGESGPFTMEQSLSYLTDALEGMDRDWLCGNMDIIEVKAETTLFEEGDDGTDAWFLLQGAARLVMKKGKGGQVILRRRVAPAGFGGFSALDAQPREADLVTESDCIFGRMKAEHFQTYVERTPENMGFFMYHFIHEIRSLYKRIHDFNRYSVRQRLALEILRIAHDWEVEGFDSKELLLPSQKDLASMIDARRESVVREIGAFYRMGALKKIGRRSHIADKDMLLKEAGDPDALDYARYSQYFLCARGTGRK